MQIGKVVGGIVFIGATAAIWLWPDAKVGEAGPEPVRPVRSVAVKDGATMPDLVFAGVVKANESRTLSFKQGGRIESIPVKKGQRTKKGERLAWLFQDDFKNNLTKAEAVAERARLTAERLRKAAANNAVSQEEVSRADSESKQADAALALARRALEETSIVAPFDGVVADVIGSELSVQTGYEPILTYQDETKSKVDVAVPETYVIRSRQYACTNGESSGARVSFDSLPGVSLPARFKEYASVADAKTQTFTATYEFDVPDDLMVLPGMTATLCIPGSHYGLVAGKAASRVEIPTSAVGVAADGSYFVWVLEETSDKGVFAARRRVVEAGERENGRLVVTKGLEPGVRIATAGVAVLEEGRRVSLLKD